MAWLDPEDVRRVLVRSGLLLAVPLVSSLGRGPSLARLVTVLSFAAAIGAPVAVEAWARAQQVEPRRALGRAFLAAYFASWLPVIEVLYLRHAPGSELSGLGPLVADPATWLGCLISSVVLLPVAGVLAVGSAVHLARPWERGGAAQPVTGAVVGFALALGLVTSGLVAGLSASGVWELEPGGGRLIALALLTTLVVGGLGTLLAVVYLCADALASAWSGRSEQDEQGPEPSP